MALKIFVFKEDQMYQSFFHWAVLCNITRNWYFLYWFVSRILDIKSLLLSLDKASRQHCHNVFLWKKIIWCKNMKCVMTFSYWWLPWANIAIIFSKSVFSKKIYFIAILSWQKLEATWHLSNIFWVSLKSIIYVIIVSY